MTSPLTIEHCVRELPGRTAWPDPVALAAVADLLRQAQAKITALGWWGFEKPNLPKAVTLSDALVFSYLESFCGKPHDGDKRVIIEAYRQLAAETGSPDSQIVIWDAHDGCTEGDVLGLLERVAEKLESGGSP